MIRALLLVGLLLASGRGAANEACTGPLEIHYSSSGTHVSVAGKELTFAWSAAKPRTGAVEQSRNAFARRSITIELSPDQISALRTWTESAAALSLVAPDGRRAPATYGSAFAFSLGVHCGSRSVQLHWSGDSEWSDATQDAKLQRAVALLLDLCRRFAKDAVNE